MIPFTQLLLDYGAVVAAVAAYIWIVGIIARVITRRFRHRIRLTGWHVPFIRFRDDASVFLFLALSGAAVSSAIAAGVGTNWLIKHSPPYNVRVFGGTAAVFLLAAWLFRLKIRRLRWYALLEISFGLVATEQAITRLADRIQPVDVLTLLTSAYLLIRGMDNFKKDMEERKKKVAEQAGSEDGGATR